MKKIIPLIIFCIFASGCASASYHRNALRDDEGDRVTVGTVQKEIKNGMSSVEVIEVLGSPNIVSTDEARREVWVYDKITSEVYYSQSGAGLKFLTPGQSGGASRSQKTLTVIIKFDDGGKVRDFAYHTSRF